MTRHRLYRDDALVYDFTEAAPVEPPVIPPVEPPVTPPVGPIPPDFPVDWDAGVGGGAYFPHDGRITAAHRVITIAFTVQAGGNPNIDVFPGTGGWLAKKITDYFPFLTNAETRGLPHGTQMDGRGNQHDAGIPLACYTPGRYYYAVSVDASQDWRIQYRP